jgi:peptide/nickel transport system substrate-binding protein
VAACETPARSKNWRHVDDPQPGSSAPSSPVVAQEASRARGLAERADTLRIHLPVDPVRLVPLGRSTEWAERISLGTVFETLLVCAEGPGGTTYAPGLAARWSIEQGGRALELELRPDVKFHDGSKLTSMDAQFSLDAARDPRTDADHLRPLFGDVSSVELAGPRGLRIWVERPSGLLLRALCSVPIVPQALYRDRPRGKPLPLIGTGPFALVEQSEPAIRLERFAGYWGKRPAIGGVVFVREADDARALSLARGGEIDVLPELDPIYRGQGEEVGMARRFVALDAAPPSFDYLVLAVDQPPLDDVRVRQAISLAIDRAAIAGKDRGGAARPIVAPVWPGGPASGAAPAVPAADPARAAALLEAAGWVDRDRDGMREKDGKRLQLVVLAADQASPPRDRVVAALRALGFFVDDRVGSPGVLLNRLRDGQFQLAFMTWNGPADGDLTSLLGTRGRHNFGRVSDPELDRLLEAMRGTWDAGERFRLAGRLGARIAEVAPIVALSAAAPPGLISRRVRGVRMWDGWLAIPELSLAADGDAE